MFKKIIAIAGIIFSTSVFAQAEKFAGASVGINAGFDNEMVSLSGPKVGNDTYSYNINGTYTFALSEQATLALGITYDLGDTTALTTTTMAALDSGYTAAYLLKSHYSINLEPGYAISDKNLAYFKLAYHSAKAYSSDFPIDKTITGTGYGFGTKYLISKNAFLNLEIQKITYNSYTYSTDSIVHSNLLGTIGVGYKF